jgi:myo-inositol-1(or 4)-monophosphatase
MVLEQKDLSRMLETAEVAARLAGQRAMEDSSYIKVSVKGPDQLVTQADTICQQIIIDRIKEAYPDDGFIGEEGPKGEMFKQPPRGSKKVWWVIDPIDGTTNFAKGMLLFTVSVAAMYEGEPVVGVIYDPATDSMFTAVKGGEARLNNRRINTGDDNFDNFSSIGTDSFFDNGVPKWVIALMEKATRLSGKGFAYRGGIRQAENMGRGRGGIDCRICRRDCQRLERQQAFPDEPRQLRGTGTDDPGSE